MGLKHLFHSTKADPADPTIIGATKWNADHYYVDGAGAPVGNVGALLLAGAAGALTHLDSVAAGKVLTSAGVGALPTWATPSVPSTFASLTVNPGPVAIGAIPAAAGALRLANVGAITARNAANTADITLLVLDASNNVNLGGTAAQVSLTGVLYASGGMHYMGTGIRFANSGGLNFYTADFASSYVGVTTNASGEIVLGTTGRPTKVADALLLDTRAKVTAPGAGQVLLQNGAGDNFSLLQFGGTTNAFPALKRVASALEVKLADDSAYATITAGNFQIPGNVNMTASGNGVLRLSNTSGNDFSLLQFGGTTAAFPALKRSGSDLEVVVASGAAHANLVANSISLQGVAVIRTGTGTPEGAVVSGVGSLFLRQDGGANTTLYVKQTGAGNTGWVAK